MPKTLLVAVDVMKRFVSNCENRPETWRQLFLLVFIPAISHRLYPRCSDIDRRFNDGSTNFDCCGHHSDGCIGHSHDRTA